MFDWFQRHKLFGLILMSVLLVTMGISLAMIQVMSDWFGDESTKGVAFKALGRDFTVSEIQEMRDNVALGSRVTGSPSLVETVDENTRSSGLDLREAVIRAILLERAARGGITASASEIEGQVEALREANEKGVERNLTAQRRTWADIRRYFREEISLRKLFIYDIRSLAVGDEDAYEEFSDTQSGGTMYSWAEVSLAAERQKVVEDLETHLRDFYEGNKGQMQTPYRLDAEWVMASVDREHSEEDIAEFHAQCQLPDGPLPELKDQPLEEARERIERELDSQARSRADQAITALGPVFDEMAGQPLDQVLAAFFEKTEGAYDDLLANSSTGGMVEDSDLPDDMKRCGLAARARGVEAQGGILRKMVGTDPDAGGISFYALARLKDREDSRQLTFAEVKAGGFAKLLDVFYDRNPQVYSTKETRLADFAIAKYERFAAEATVEEEVMREFYDLHADKLWAAGDGATKAYEEVEDEIRDLVRRRDAVDLAREALETLKSRAEALGGTVELLELAAGTPVTVIRAAVEQGDSALDDVAGFEDFKVEDRNRIYYAAYGMTASDIEEGKVSAMTDLGTFSVIAKVVSRTESSIQELNDNLRARLLDDFIGLQTLAAMRERMTGLQQRASLPQAGAEDPESWDDAEKLEWRHKNRTRFEKVAAEEGLETRTTEKFYKDTDDEVEYLSDLEFFDRRRRGITLSNIQIIPNLPVLPQDVGERDIYCLVTAARTQGVPRSETTADQLDSARSAVMRERQEEVQDSYFKLSKLKQDPNIGYEAIGKDYLGIDLSPELVEKKKPQPRQQQQTIQIPAGGGR